MDEMNDALLRRSDAAPEPRVMPSYEQCQPYPAPYDGASAVSDLDASASAPQPRIRQYLSVAMAGLSVVTMGGLCFGFDSCASDAACASRSRALAAVRPAKAAADLSHCPPAASSLPPFRRLYPLLYSSGAFSGSCCDAERDTCSARPASLQREKCCSAQESNYVALASASLFAADGVFVLYGEVRASRTQTPHTFLPF
jgi:hypothetical protein